MARTAGRSGYSAGHENYQQNQRRHRRPRLRGRVHSPLAEASAHAAATPSASATPEKLNAVGDYFGVEKRYTDFKELLKDPGGRRRPHQHARSPTTPG